MLDTGLDSCDFLNDFQLNTFDSSVWDVVVVVDEDDNDVKSKVSAILSTATKAANAEKMDAHPYAVRSP